MPPRAEGALLTGDHEGIVMAENESCVLLVNRDAREKQVCWKGAFSGLTDAFTNEVVAAEKNGNGVTFTIGKSMTVILKK